MESPILIKIIKPSYDWVNAFHDWPIFLTALIVICAAAVTYRSNRKSVEAQNKIADQRRQDEHENKISEFRHQWLQDVRETAASLCQVIHDSQVFIAQRNLVRERLEQAQQKGDVSNIDEFSQQVFDLNEKLKEFRSKYFWLYSKLQLLFKKGEQSTIELFGLLDEVRDSIYDFETTALNHDQIKKVIENLQVVLKSEWEVTKDRAWKAT